jgi:hypothetical protein
MLPQTAPFMPKPTRINGVAVPNTLFKKSVRVCNSFTGGAKQVLKWLSFLKHFKTNL